MKMNKKQIKEMLSKLKFGDITIYDKEHDLILIEYIDYIDNEQYIRLSVVDNEKLETEIFEHFEIKNDYDQVINSLVEYLYDTLEVRI